MTYKFIYYGILIFFIPVTMCGRILAVFPSLFFSHHLVYRNYINTFISRGHQVVLITPYPEYSEENRPRNLTEVDISKISHKIWGEGMAKIFTDTENDPTVFVRDTYELIINMIEKQIQSDEVMNILTDKSVNFDLLLLESSVRITLAFSHHYRVPVVMISTFGPFFENYESVGASIQPLLYPQNFRSKIYNLTVWDKVSELYTNQHFENIIYDGINSENEILKRTYLNDVPSIEVLKNNIHMLYMNTHPLWDSLRPVPTTVVYTYGLHKNPHKELPEDLKAYMDASENGIIYASFGTTAYRSIHSKKLQLLLEVFSRLPYNILFKWNDAKLPGKPNNVKIAKWFPQADLLRHPKVKAFITQGGVQSTDEAIIAGIPLIGIPLAYDQWFNTEKYVNHGIGIAIDINTVTVEQMVLAVNTVIKDKSYTNNLKRIREILFDQPQKPLERVITWTEYLLRYNGAKHLASPAANLPWTEYFEAELILILFFITLIFFAIIYRILSKLTKYTTSVILTAVK